MIHPPNTAGLQAVVNPYLVITQRSCQVGSPVVGGLNLKTNHGLHRPKVQAQVRRDQRCHPPSVPMQCAFWLYESQVLLLHNVISGDNLLALSMQLLAGSADDPKFISASTTGTLTPLGSS